MSEQSAWTDRRVLLLHGTHPLSCAVIRQLMPTTAHVTSILPTAPSDGQVLPQQLHISRGPANLRRLRSLLAVGEFDVILQHAETRADLELTRELLMLIATPTVVMLTLPATLRVTISPAAETPIRLGVVRMPELFGPGVREAQSWLTRAFSAAAAGRVVPRPPDTETPVLYIEDAAAAVLARAAQMLTQPPTTLVSELAIASSSRAELYQQLTRSAETVAITATKSWYRQQPVGGTQDESLGRAA